MSAGCGPYRVNVTFGTDMGRTVRATSGKRPATVSGRFQIRPDAHRRFPHHPMFTGVAQAYSNQKKIDFEVKALHSNAATLTKQTNQWLTLINNFNDALKEIGDVQNWAKLMEADMQTIAGALEYSYKVSRDETESKSGASTS